MRMAKLAGNTKKQMPQASAMRPEASMTPHSDVPVLLIFREEIISKTPNRPKKKAIIYGTTSAIANGYVRKTRPRIKSRMP